MPGRLRKQRCKVLGKHPNKIRKIAFSSERQKKLASPHYLRTVFDEIPEAVVALDLSGRTLQFNKRSAELFECTHEEAMNFAFLSDNNPGLWEKTLCGESQRFEWSVRRAKDEPVVDVDVSVSKVTMANEDFIIAVFRDIRKRKRAEEELLSAKNFLTTVLNNTYDAVYVHNLDGTIAMVNDKAIQLHGAKSREEMIGLNILGLISPEVSSNLKEVEACWSRALAGEKQFIESEARKLTNDSLFPVEVYVTKLPLPHGDWIIANVRDVTDRKRAEEELLSAKNFLTTVLNNTYDAVYVHNLDGTIAMVNDKAIQLHGAKSREEMIGLRIQDVSGPDCSLKKLEEYWSRVIKGEDQFHEWQARRLSDGSVFPVEVYQTRVTLPNGDFVLANVRDITERKKMEKSLAKEKQIFFSALRDNPHGIALIDNEERFTHVNPEFTNITGYSIEDLTSWQDWVQVVHGEEESLLKVLYRQRVDGTVTTSACGIICKNGQRKEVDCRVTCLEDRCMVVLTDITLQKRAENRLRVEKQKFEAFSEGLPLGLVIIEWSDEAFLRYSNPKFREIFGYKSDDLLDLNTWIATLVCNDSDLFLSSAPDWISTLKNPNWESAEPYIRQVNAKDGKQRYVKFIAIQLETGEILITCEDVTLSKQAQEKLMERNLELESLNDLIVSVSQSLHLTPILDDVKRIFVEKLGIHAGGIFVYDRNNKKFRTERLWGVPVLLRFKFEDFVLKCFTSGFLIDRGSVCLVRGTLDPAADLFDKKWRSYLCMGLCEEGEINTMAFLADKDYQRFGDDHISFYGAIATQIDVATRNAKLFEQMQRSESQMKELSHRLVNVQEAERRYVAKELHDEIGQVLTGLNLALEMHAMELGTELSGRLLEAKSTVHKLVTSVRELSLKLRPSMLDDLGLLPTLRWYFERLFNKTRVRVLFQHAHVDGKRFTTEVETAVYRIVQEALTNVARYAKVDEVAVRLWCDNEMIKVQIDDHGVGFDPQSKLQAGNTAGLGGIKERATLLGGSFAIQAQPGSGTCLIAELPIDARAKERL
ncbi:MAG: Oxygen sensor histidine kinase NreB [Syntrophorhabdus sp. PtaU1.Bin153]|nr:MAG: Oxygen sensor histidine kinase NreB [Syntrophorhabdus sp. PtaU1.Bin153]